MKPSEKKADRLLKIEALLLGHPEGMTQSELARRLGVNRSSINRYIPDLPKHIYFEDGGRLLIDREAYLINVRFNLHEALAIHLAARLMATRMDRQNPHAAAALRKLGVSLEKLAPRISSHLQGSADTMDDSGRNYDPVYLQALEKLTLAWAEQLKAYVWHRSDRTGKVSEYCFASYFIEPYAIGQTTMVIGFSQPPEKLRTLKVERIERVELSKEPYQIPSDFDPRKLLEDAWGIWYTENEPIEVILHFSFRVAHRVCETRWHRSELVEHQQDGSIIWKAMVAEPLEMLNWIRGWGVDVEVLKPEGIRQAISKEVKQLALLYGV
jgi:CRISPR-associated endonuclease/helicase Cas3